MSWDLEGQLVMYFIVFLACMLSLVTCGYACWKMHKNLNISSIEVKPIFILLIMDMLLCLSSIIPAAFMIEQLPGMCSLQGILLEIFSSSKMIWTSFIAFTIMYDFIHGRSKEHLNYNCILFGVMLYSLMTGVIPGVTLDYGVTGPWCWFNNHKNDSERDKVRYQVYLYVFRYGMLWILITFNFIAYCYVANELKRNVHSPERLMYMRNFRIYPFILCIGYIPISIIRLAGPKFDRGLYEVKFNVVAGAIARLVGFFDSIAYAIYNPDIFKSKVELSDPKMKRELTVNNQSL